MASIRRTLSPANHDRSSSSLYQNGSSLPVVNQWSNKPSNSRFSVELRRLFSRRYTWRKPIYRCLVFFIIGFLLGILRFNSIDDNLVRNHDFSFENNVNMNSFRKNDVVLKAGEERIESIGAKNEFFLKGEEENRIKLKFDDSSPGKNEEKRIKVKLSEFTEEFEYKNPRKDDVVVETEEEKTVKVKLSEIREEFEYKNPRKDDVDLETEEKKVINVKLPEIREDFEFKNPRKDDVVLEADEEKTIKVKLSENSEGFEYKNPRKLLIVVTPTYNRVLQAYYLNRLGQVLRLVNSPVLWIVVEMNVQSTETAAILRNVGVMYRHLVCRKNFTNVKDRGVHQRNTGLEHIELHRLDGVVYFADDDNVYSLELFEAIRDISRFGTWPVAMLAQNKNKAILEGPVCNGSQVIGWHTNEKSKRLRRFHVDMSGFAFNSTILWDPKRWKHPFLNPIRQLDTVKEGFQETTFIEQVVAEESQMEGIPHGCGKIMNWHLHLDSRGVDYPRGWVLQKNR